MENVGDMSNRGREWPMDKPVAEDDKCQHCQYEADDPVIYEGQKYCKACLLGEDGAPPLCLDPEHINGGRELLGRKRCHITWPICRDCVAAIVEAAMENWPPLK